MSRILAILFIAASGTLPATCYITYSHPATNNLRVSKAPSVHSHQKRSPTRHQQGYTNIYIYTYTYTYTNESLKVLIPRL